MVSFAGTSPVGRAPFAGMVDGQTTFWSRPGIGSEVRTYLLGRSLVAATLTDWPPDATLQAMVDVVGPGGHSAWIAAGSDAGVAVGDSWWLRIAGQPAARCDVLHVAPRACFCSIVPLANKPTTLPGTRVALWPAPAERRNQRASSAVAFTEVRGENTLVWIAAPPRWTCPPDTHVDFYHEAAYIGHGLVERHDDRFWYVQFVASARAAGSKRPPGPQVGDDAIIRTPADISQRRFIARVFELTPAGALLNAGEADALAVGDTLRASREGQSVEVVVRQVRRTYSVVTPADPADAFALHVGDELYLRPAPAPARVIGSIERVVDETLFSARLMDRTIPSGAPVAVQNEGRTIGVAVLVTLDQDRAGGVAMPCSLTQPLAAGMQLSWDTQTGNVDSR